MIFNFFCEAGYFGTMVTYFFYISSFLLSYIQCLGVFLAPGNIWLTSNSFCSANIVLDSSFSRLWIHLLTQHLCVLFCFFFSTSARHSASFSRYSANARINFRLRDGMLVFATVTTFPGGGAHDGNSSRLASLIGTQSGAHSFWWSTMDSRFGPLPAPDLVPIGTQSGPNREQFIPSAPTIQWR